LKYALQSCFPVLLLHQSHTTTVTDLFPIFLKNASNKKDRCTLFSIYVKCSIPVIITFYSFVA